MYVCMYVCTYTFFRVPYLSEIAEHLYTLQYESTAIC